MKLFSTFLLLLFFSSANSCDRCAHKSKAAIFSAPSSITAGACGYGSMVFDQGYTAAAVSSLIFRDGVGCGSCFQIRCREAKLCNGAGVKVVVIDVNIKSNSTDFLIGGEGFAAMALPGMAAGLKRLGAVQVEHKRIPCVYLNKNLSIRVEESSRKPSLLTVKLMYQGGQTDIVAADVASVWSPAWQFLSRTYGPIWITTRAPAGPLQFRFVVTGGYDGKWVWAQQEVLPAEWRTGEVYDAGVRINDIAQESCSPCDAEEWR